MFVFNEIRWAELSRDLNWQKRILIADLLPSVGNEQTFGVTWGAMPLGHVNFLWCPPHSEFNGFFDRPYEFLKVRIISGILQEEPSDSLRKIYQYKFTVKNIRSISVALEDMISKRIMDGLSDVEVSRQSFLPDAGDVSTWSYVGWSDFLGGGNLIYLECHDYEYHYHSFIVEKKGEYFLIYDYHDISGIEKGRLMNVKLMDDDIQNLEKIMQKSTPLDCSGRYLLADDEVQGAEYC